MFIAPIKNVPDIYPEIVSKTESIGFNMASDIHLCSLLRSLVASKPGGKFLELGTGTGLALSWIVDGMDTTSSVISIDHDPRLTEIANSFLKDHKQVEIICADGSEWLQSYRGDSFDLIFADAWPGKYSELEKTLSLLNPGGIYFIDDMLPQPNWPEGHEDKARQLTRDLENRDDLILTKLEWSTGVMLGVKK